MAIPIEQIYKNIRDMDYITVIPRQTPVPNFYELEDGTIVGVITNVNHLLPNPANPNGVSANLAAEILVFVPQNKRDPHGKQVEENTSMTIIEEDVDYTPLKESFNVYDLSNGVVLSVKTVLGQVQKTDLHTRVGEPVYNISTQPIIKVKRGNNSPKRTR